MDFLTGYLSSSGFMPHGHCFLWTAPLLWSYVLSDALISLAYYSIPVTLWYFVRRRPDVPFSWVFVMFAVFIFACGTTHVIAIWNIWQPVYWLDASVKVATAAASVITALLLWPLLPRVLSLPNPRLLEESNRRLQEEVAERKKVEQQLHDLNHSLERRIAERVGQIAAADAELRRHVSERRETEQALLRSQRLLQALADNMTALIWVKDPDGRYLLVNRAYESLFELHHHEIIGKTDYELFPREQATIFRAVDQRAIASGEPVQAEEAVLREGKSVTLLSVKCPLLNDDGEVYALCGVSTDITERKSAEEALAEERTLLRTLIDALPDVVFTKDSGGRFTMCNAAELRLLGFTDESELLGKTVFDLYPPELAERFHADDLRALRGQSVLNQEEPGIDAAGNPRWNLTIKVPLRNHAGAIVGLVGMSHDVTDRKRSEDNLHRAQKLEALGTLAGGVAHDFNNILLAINGNAKLAIADLAPDHPAQQSLQEIKQAASRATDLVRRILSFSRGEEPNRAPTQLQPVIEEALAMLRPTLPALVKISADLPPGLPAVAADATQIHQILINLATNAAHAIGPRNGRIEIQLTAVQVTAEMVPMMPDLRAGQYLRLSVSDDGCGMDGETLGRIFDPFFTTKPVGEGTGLGLSVVHGIMRAHEGAISVYSVVGKGTTFKLYFPALAADAPEQTIAPRAVGEGAGERVLYVDDEEPLVRLASRMLQRLGYRVTGCADPLHALDLFRAAPDEFDVVVTDLSMPSISGFALASALRETRPNLPIVLTSGYLRAEDQLVAEQLGIHALILKPNTIEELTEVLDQLFRHRPAKAAG